MMQSRFATKLLLALAGTALVTVFAIVTPRTGREPNAAGPASPTRRPTSESTEPPGDLAGALAELREQSLRLEQRSEEITRVLAALGGRLEDLESGQHAARDSRDGSEGVPPELDPARAERAQAEERERAEKQMQGQLQLLEDALLREEADSAWSASAQIQLADAFQGVSEQGLWLESADCRSTYCGIQVGVDPTAPEEETLRAFQHLSPWNGEAFFSFKAGENGGALLYLAREGHALPRFEEAEQAVGRP